MPTLHIAEYPGLAATVANEGAVPILPVPPTTEQVIALLNTMTAIPVPFQPTTAWVELCTDTTCSIVFGPYATLSTIATLTSSSGQGRLNANERIIRRIPFSPTYVNIPQNSPASVPYGLTAVITT
jgi:hypothetical protein